MGTASIYRGKANQFSQILPKFPTTAGTAGKWENRLSKKDGKERRTHIPLISLNDNKLKNLIHGRA